MNIYEKLLNVQLELKAPKGQYNNFGKYRYRSCEDILEALKPVLAKYSLAMFISDTVKNIGSITTKKTKDSEETKERIYIETTITLINTEKPEEKITTTALAREEETKKGMDGSQITGTASSYARKYALNGLFAIDDTKDSDTNERHTENQNRAKTETSKKESTEAEKRKKAIEAINAKCDDKSKQKWLLDIIKTDFKKNSLEELTEEELKRMWGRVK